MNNNFNENIELINNENSYTMIKIIVLLIALQISGIVLREGMFIFLPYSELNDILISMITMFLLTLFIIYKCKKEKISLGVFSFTKNKESKIYYFLVSICILFLIFISPSFSMRPSLETLLPLIYTAIMIPIYEEFIFRSYIWGILENENINEMKIYFLTTILFALYNIGYIGSSIITNGFNHMAIIIFIKLLSILSYGLFIGFFRYKIKNTYFCILIHSFINIFGR